MKIDRHNYEECFILYWDNELTAVQKQAVEKFVAENADLQEEFKVFGETRFIPDGNIQIGEKEFLQNDSFINITSYEEQLLDYIDDELAPDENKKVERFAAQYPAIQKELALLQKTKVQPEDISFPDKSVLYRREEKVRVISIFWRRVAVAAAIILIAGLVTFRLVNNKTVNDDSIAGDNELKTQEPVNTQSVVTQPMAVPEKDQQASGLAKITDKVNPDLPKTEDNGYKKSTIKPKVYKPVENLIAAHQPENKNSLPKEKNRNNTSQENQNTSTQPIIANVDMPNVKRDDTRVAKSDIEKTHIPETDGVTKSPTPTFAIYNDEKVEKEKGGLKEFLRKTTRLFERRTKIQTTTEDNKLLLGAFAVSLK